MATSHKPIVWSLFAAGGTFSAFVTPVMIVISGFALSLGLLPAEALAYERMIALVDTLVGKGAVFVIVFLPAWHAAHRLRITAHDFGLRADFAVALICYSLAALATLVTLFTLFRI